MVAVSISDSRNITECFFIQKHLSRLPVLKPMLSLPYENNSFYFLLSSMTTTGDITNNFIPGVFFGSSVE
jgi:hypothetical protein